VAVPKKSFADNILLLLSNDDLEYQGRIDNVSQVNICYSNQQDGIHWIVAIATVNSKKLLTISRVKKLSADD